MPTLIFNTSTGSDTTASGSQGTIVANGTNASFSGSVVTLDGSPDLSGFAAPDDILWLQTDSGRQFFDGSSVDDGADTFTTVDAPAGTSTGLTWGIGGKRNTFDNTDSRNVFSDFKNRWTIETETSQSLAGGVIIVDGVNDQDFNDMVYIQGSSGSRKTITQTTNAANFERQTTGPKTLGFRRLKLECTDGTRTTAYGVVYTDDSVTPTDSLTFIDCELGDATNKLTRGIFFETSNDRMGIIILINCWIHDCTSDGLKYVSSNSGKIHCVFSQFTDNAGTGLDCNGTGGPHFILGSIFANNSSGSGLDLRLGVSQNIINGNTFYNNSVDGLHLTQFTLDGPLVLANNIFKDNGAWGIGGTDPTFFTVQLVHLNTNNCYHNNTSGTVEETGLGEGENVQLIDPGFTDADNNDFSIGPALKALGFPSDIAGAGETASFVDIGPAQREEKAGGVIGSNLSGGMLT